MNIEREVKQLPFWNELTPSEREAVLGCARIREYKRGSLIYSPEQECLGLIRLLSGSGAELSGETLGRLRAYRDMLAEFRESRAWERII